MFEQDNLFVDEIETPLGVLTVVADASGRLHAVGWVDDHDRMARQLESYVAAVKGSLARRRDPGGACAALRLYFAGDLRAIDGLHTEMRGTAFQRAVWAALLEIPCGETRSYGDIARRIGRPNAVRAVGLANGANPVAIVVPCHRVIGADHSLTGYGGGIERKRWLLAHEGRLGANLELALTS